MNERNFEDWRASPWLGLHNALCFLSLSGSQKLLYLPGKFPEMLFHLSEGDLLTDNPLKFMAAICNQECRKHTGNPEADDLLKCIVGVLEAMDDDERHPHWHPHEMWSGDAHWYSPSAKVWDALGYLAKGVLKVLQWEARNPSLKCEELLDRHSYGSYSAIPRGNA